MASIVNRPGGRRWIAFTGLDGRRKTLRLGKASKSIAQAAKRHVEALLASRAWNEPPEPRQAEWLRGLSELVYSRVVAVGLADPRRLHTVGDLLDDFGASQKTAESTRETMAQTVEAVRRFFGEERRIVEITEGDAQDFATQLGATLAESTASRRRSRAKQIFEHGVRREWLDRSPFRSIKRGKESNRDRDHFVAVEVAELLMSRATPDLAAVIALNRFGGLRCTSEVLALKWVDVDFEAARLIVRSSKTGTRHTPLFPEVAAALGPLWDAAPEGAVYVIPRITKAGLRKRFYRLCELVGVDAWKKPFQNMRSTRASELRNDYPEPTVNAWLGHSQAVAESHYYQISKDHWDRAVGRIPANGGPEQESEQPRPTAG